MMNCNEVLALLNDYVDGQPGTPLCRDVESHLEECDSCQVLVENVRQAINLCQAHRPVMRIEFHDRLRSSLRGAWGAQFGPEKLPKACDQQQVLLEELRKVTSHPTAAQLHELAKHRLPTIPLAVVRQYLDLLTQLGRAQRLETSGFEPRFDGNIEPHDHVRCVHCGRLDDLDRIHPDHYQWDRRQLRAV